MCFSRHLILNVVPNLVSYIGLVPFQVSHANLCFSQCPVLQSYSLKEKFAVVLVHPHLFVEVEPQDVIPANGHFEGNTGLCLIFRTITGRVYQAVMSNRKHKPLEELRERNPMWETLTSDASCLQNPSVSQLDFNFLPVIESWAVLHIGSNTSGSIHTMARSSVPLNENVHIFVQKSQPPHTDECRTMLEYAQYVRL